MQFLRNQTAMSGMTNNDELQHVLEKRRRKKSFLGQNLTEYDDDLLWMKPYKGSNKIILNCLQKKKFVLWLVFCRCWCFEKLPVTKRQFLLQMIKE